MTVNYYALFCLGEKQSYGLHLSGFCFSPYCSKLFSFQTESKQNNRRKNGTNIHEFFQLSIDEMEILRTEKTLLQRYLEWMQCRAVDALSTSLRA
jgi:hypothetical protein